MRKCRSAPSMSMSWLRFCFAQGALVDLLVEAVDVALAAALFARADRGLVGGKLRETRPEARIDVFVEHLGAGIDVRVDVIDPKAVFHGSSPPSQCAAPLSHSGAGFAYENSGVARRRREPAVACIALFASPRRSPILPSRGGCSSMAEQKLPKLTTRVRFPSPAPIFQTLMGLKRC